MNIANIGWKNELFFMHMRKLDVIIWKHQIENMSINSIIQHCQTYQFSFISCKAPPFWKSFCYQGSLFLQRLGNSCKQTNYLVSSSNYKVMKSKWLTEEGICEKTISQKLARNLFRKLLKISHLSVSVLRSSWTPLIAWADT